MASDSSKTTKRLYQFKDARRMARQYGFASREEFIDYECAGVYQLPKDPEIVWANNWQGWDDFLGVTLGFEEALTVTQSLGFKSKDEYLSCLSEGCDAFNHDELASRLPYRPDVCYEKDWKGWSHFLGLLNGN